MIDSTPSTSTSLNALDRLANGSKACVVNQEQISQYLLRFPDVTGVAGDLLGDARREFGPEAEIRLELCRDPEIEDEYLRVCVRVAQYSSDVRHRLQTIAAAYEEQLAAISGYVCLTTDYRPVSADAV